MWWCRFFSIWKKVFEVLLRRASGLRSRVRGESTLKRLVKGARSGSSNANCVTSLLFRGASNSCSITHMRNLFWRDWLRVSVLLRKTASANNFPKICRDCEQSLHFYAKIVTIDTRLLWRSISCIKAFKVMKIHKGIAVNRFFQIAYTHEIVCSW